MQNQMFPERLTVIIVAIIALMVLVIVAIVPDGSLDATLVYQGF
jgi:hypothetical protein